MAAAARELHVSASAISLAIGDLERALGTQLLIRQPHQPLALTPAGQDLIGDMRRLVAGADDLQAAAERIGTRPSGPLRVGCFRTLGPIHLPAVIAEMASAHPEIDLTVSEASLAELQDDLLAGKIEAAVMYRLDVRDRIETEVLVDTRPHVIVGPNHRLARRKRIRLEEVIDDPMVLLDVHPSEVYFRSVLASVGLEPRVVRTTGSFETLRSLVARDIGWSLLIGRPHIAVSYEGLAVHAVAIADPIEPMPVVLATVAGTRSTRRSEAFRQVCRRVMGERVGG